MEPVIYLDNNATTRVDPEVFEAMKPFFCERYGNPSSIYTFGGELAADIERARIEVAELLGASWRNNLGQATEIIFTSCGTESDNAALRSALEVQSGRRKIVTSKVEHPAILNLCRELEREGYTVETIGVDGDGRLDMAALERAVDSETALVTLMWANNEIGNIYPVEEVARIAHRAGALFHTDAVQAAGKVPMNMSESEIDMLSISGHKLHAPKGVGVLYVRRGVRFRPFIIGGHQEKGMRAGTYNNQAILGLGKAAELARENLEEEHRKLWQMRTALRKGIEERIPDVIFNGSDDESLCLPGTLNVSFPRAEGESILLYLDFEGIEVSTGSACATGSLEPSYVLLASGLDVEFAHGSVRFSFGRYNTMDDVEYVLEKLPPIIEKVRSMSTRRV